MHGCLGESFAYLQIKAIWSHLLRNFELEMAGPFPEIDWNAMAVGVKGEGYGKVQEVCPKSGGKRGHYNDEIWEAFLGVFVGFVSS
ncbi:hypothetical protein AMTR_s00140p00101200 [Amborella trichopoda]|uniref:Uncharacterized protein n=1 Tax=Amborella trichopoda TaxID=13333 RepID=W1PAT6_AMBTC|nr:hypothetical protein AMTR_s00140p00101200 [Amborella trichopoda]